MITWAALHISCKGGDGVSYGAAARPGDALAMAWDDVSEFGASSRVDRGGDLDGDGRADLVVGFNDAVMVVYAAAGTETARSSASAVIQHSYEVGPVVDITGDGRDDLVFGTHVFSTPPSGDVALSDADLDWPDAFFLTVGDFDGDGTRDLLAQSTVGALFLGPIDQGGTVTPSAELATDYRWGPSVADFDGDGRDDLIGIGNEFVLWLDPMTAAGSTASWTDVWPDRIASGDYDADGTPELCIGHQTSLLCFDDVLDLPAGLLFGAHAGQRAADSSISDLATVARAAGEGDVLAVVAEAGDESRVWAYDELIQGASDLAGDPAAVLPDSQVEWMADVGSTADYDGDGRPDLAVTGLVTTDTGSHLASWVFALPER